MARKRMFPKSIECGVCGKKFSYNSKTHPFGRLSAHMNKSHKTYMKRRRDAGMSKAKTKRKKDDIRPLDLEFMAIDDLLLSDALTKGKEYSAVHEQLGGLIIEALLPIAIETITKAIQKRKAKK